MKKVNGKSVRDYKRQYEKYDGRPDVIKDRDTRNAARAIMAKRGLVHKGDGKDVHHVKPLSKGGARTKVSNLRVVSASTNRSFARNANGSIRTQRSKSGK